MSEQSNKTQSNEGSTRQAQSTARPYRAQDNVHVSGVGVVLFNICFLVGLAGVILLEPSWGDWAALWIIGFTLLGFFFRHKLHKGVKMGTF